MVDPSILEELSRYGGNEYQPEAGRRPGIDMLPNGPCDCEIVDAILTRTEKTREPIVKLGLRIAGTVYEFVWFLQSQDHFNRLAGDLQTLGFPLPQPHPQQGLPVALGKLPGIKFRAFKSSNPGQAGKMFHNLSVNARSTGTAMPPPLAPLAPPPQAIPASQPVVIPRPSAAPVSDPFSEIPF